VKLFEGFIGDKEIQEIKNWLKAHSYHIIWANEFNIEAEEKG